MEPKRAKGLPKRSLAERDWIVMPKAKLRALSVGSRFGAGYEKQINQQLIPNSIPAVIKIQELQKLQNMSYAIYRYYQIQI